MFRIESIAARGVAVLACLLLASCGGGGADAGGNRGGGGTGTLTLSTSTLSFVTNSPVVTPQPQQVSATVTGASGDVYLLIVVSGNAVADIDNIQVTGENSGTALILPVAATTLGPGTHSSTITVTACTTSVNCTSGIIGQPRTIHVTYTITGMAFTPASSEITITDHSQPASYSTTMTIRSSSPWTATSQNPHVTVSPTSSSAPTTQVTLTLDATAVQQMSIPAGFSLANVSIVSGFGQTSLGLGIRNNTTRLIAAMPRVEPAGETGEVYFHGQNLNLAPFGSVLFGATSAPAIGYDGATMMRATHPALTAGTYPVTYTAVPRNDASIVVVNTLGAAASTLAYPADGRTRSVAEMHFDAERSALVLVVQYPPLSGAGEAATEVLRYTYGGSWTAPSVRPMPYLSSLALRNDGAGWLATRLINNAASNAIQTCTADFSSCTDQLAAPATSVRWKQIVMTNDNQPVVVSVPQPAASAPGDLLRYSMVNRSMSTIAAGALNDGVVAVSRDGQSIVLGSGAMVGGAPLPLQIATTGSASLSSLPAVSAAVTRLAMSRNAPLVLVNGRRIIDTGVMRIELGLLPATTLGGVLNQAGTKAYTFDANGTIRTFNLLAAIAPGSLYPEVGSAIVPAGDPGAGTSGAELRMAISPDSRTLFLAGSARVVVQPLP